MPNSAVVAVSNILISEKAMIKVARELGSERRETVRSLSVAGVGRLRGPDSVSYTHLDVYKRQQ